MNPTPGDGRREGRKLKDEALSLHERLHRNFLLRGRRLLISSLLRALQTATIDDVRKDLPLPSGLNPKCYAAVTSGLAAAKVITCVGFVASTRPEAHARPVRVWRLTDRTAAERWLADNPLPEDQRPPHDGPQLLLEI